MVYAILINKVSVKCLPGLVHEVRHAVSVRLENIQVRHRSRSPPGSLSLTSQAFSGLYLVVVPRHCRSNFHSLSLKWGVTINYFGKCSVVSAYKSIQVTWIFLVKMNFQIR